MKKKQEEQFSFDSRRNRRTQEKYTSPTTINSLLVEPFHGRLFIGAKGDLRACPGSGRKWVPPT